MATSHIQFVGPDDGEHVQIGPNTMRLVQTGADTDHHLGVGMITMPPGVGGPPGHWHAEHDEGFYVVSGHPTFTGSDGVAHETSPGTWVMVPRGAGHAFANPGDEVAVIVSTFSPDTYVQYFLDARDLARSGRPPSPETVVRIQQRYATYPIGHEGP